MKRHYSLILALFAAILLAAPARACADDAFAALPFDQTGTGVVTVITDTQGEAHRFDGALNAAALEKHADAAVKIASYAVEYEGREIFNVELHDFEAEPARRGLSLLGVSDTVVQPTLTNGYGSITFDYDEGEGVYQNCTVFLTGLKVDQLDETQQMVLDSLRSGLQTGLADEDPFLNEKMDLSALSFIDAEKLATVDKSDTHRYSGDSELCWAGATSNLLHYTGWAAKASESLPAEEPSDEEPSNEEPSASAVDFSTEDALFDLFAASFNDGPGHISFGLKWFFNGIYDADDHEMYPADKWSQWETRENGDYLHHYPIQLYSKSYMTETDASKIDEVTEKLREGYGVGISLAWSTDDGGDRHTADGGHAITLWGYIKVKNTETFSTSNYVALLTADPDSDPVNNRITKETDPSKDRTKASNMMCLMPLTAAEIQWRGSETEDYRTIDNWWVDAHNAKCYGMLSEFVVLEPYRDQAPDEGTCSLNSSPDLILERQKREAGYVEPLFLSDGADDYPMQYENEDEMGTYYLNKGYRTVFGTDSEIGLSLLWVTNAGGESFAAEPISFTVELKRGETPMSTQTGQCTLHTGSAGIEAGRSNTVASDRIRFGQLSAGTYTAHVTLEPGAQQEAYYYNNGFDVTFTVTTPADASGLSVAEETDATLTDHGEVRNGNPVYELPLTLTGVDVASVKAIHVVTYFKGGPKTDWSDVTLYESYGPTDALVAKVYPCYAFRVRVMIEPRDPDKPWLIREMESPITMSSMSEISYTMTYYYNDEICSWVTYDLLAHKITLDNGIVPYAYLFAAGYDEDGRMVFLSAPEYSIEERIGSGYYDYNEEDDWYDYVKDGTGDYMVYTVRISIPSSVKTVRVFWFGNGNVTGDGEPLSDPLTIIVS